MSKLSVVLATLGWADEIVIVDGESSDKTANIARDGYKARVPSVPSKDAEKLLYVVIELDPGYEGRIKDWLKIREGDGKVIGEKIVKVGIIVQTRIR